jgi:hypothetical protein
MDHIQQSLRANLFNKLKPTLRNFPSHQFNSPVLCLKAFIQDGDGLDDDGTYEANRRYPRVKLLYR